MAARPSRSSLPEGSLVHGTTPTVCFTTRVIEPIPPGRWLARGAFVAVLVYTVAAVATLGLVQRARTNTRLSRDAVTGRAATALGDSGVFASPIVPSDVRVTIPHADAESAAVAMGYNHVPSYPVMGGPYPRLRRMERRHYCGRTYYVRPVVALPDSAEVASLTSDLLMKVSPTWVMPVCDDAGFVRTSVIFADAPTRLRVIQGDQPGDVPELALPEPVFPQPYFPHIVGWDAGIFPDWERGIAMTPETAVAVAVAQLVGTGARVAEVPEAFTIVLPPFRPSQQSIPVHTGLQTHLCSRWRLTLDRPVMLRGMSSGQVVRTRVVSVARNNSGCAGTPTLQIPLPTQPATLPYQYGVIATPAAPPRADHPTAPLPLETRSISLRVTAPVNYEDARPLTANPR